MNVDKDYFNKTNLHYFDVNLAHHKLEALKQLLSDAKEFQKL